MPIFAVSIILAAVAAATTAVLYNVIHVGNNRKKTYRLDLNLLHRNLEGGIDPSQEKFFQ